MDFCGKSNFLGNFEILNFFEKILLSSIMKIFRKNFIKLFEKFLKNFFLFIFERFFKKIFAKRKTTPIRVGGFMLLFKK